MALINKSRDSVLRGRGYSLKLGALSNNNQNGKGGPSSVDHFKNLGMIDNEDLLLEGTDENSLMNDVEKNLDSQLVSFEEAM